MRIRNGERIMRFSTTLAPCNEANVSVYDDVRISVLSDRIIRVEKGAFTDNKTQMVSCRNFANPHFTVQKAQDKVLILTDKYYFCIDLDSLNVYVKPLEEKDWRKASNSQNLGGTARTLDGTFGVLFGWKRTREANDHFCLSHIRKGLFAKNGVSEIDDVKSVLLMEDGSVKQREKTYADKYVFVFEDDYLGGLKEFYSLCGYTPLLPKYALGNWWSRYHAYTQDEYIALMDEFAKKDVPLTVATVDMDWHIVKNAPKDADYKSFQGVGWTGYTFEKELFPDHKKFLADLKERDLAVTMNLHPRDGVRYFEEQYPEMAKACDIDPTTKKTVEFDLTDEKFLNAYFDILHHPYEKEGVDFWWIDWQQGTKSKMKNLDPLWLLNHYHTLDICRDGKNGIILSRYSGLGSHRYPLGFSGDTVVCWNSLRIQPYFTALASNAGYTWWSHDIGGHLFGKGDQELYLRWLQFGVFSPVNRLHSNNKSMSKEPWNYPQVESVAEDFMRLRHRLLPYLYTANVRTAEDGVPLVCPLYYYVKDKNAYAKRWRNEYFFGEQMLVCPVVKRGKNGATKMKIRLPEGNWTHFFSGVKFVGDREYEIECPLDQYPVFVKDGGIVPLLDVCKEDKLNCKDFKNLTVKIYPGENSYTMYDETGFVAFDMRKTDGGYALTVTPSDDCKTEKLSFEIVGLQGGKTLVNGEEKSLKNLDCVAMTIEF